MKPLVLIVAAAYALHSGFTADDLWQFAFCLLAGVVAFCEAVNDVRVALRGWAW